MSATGLISRLGVKVSTTRGTTAADDTGYPKVTQTAHLSNVSAFVQPLSGSEALRYGRENSEKFHRIYFAAGTDVEPQDEITYEGRTFIVQSIRHPGEHTSGGVAHLVVEALERD